MSTWLPLGHLRRLTDDTGIIQHALYGVPDPTTGYTLDDNARALIVAVRAHRRTGEVAAGELAARYLGFVRYAQHPAGGFHNLLAYDRTWLDERGSDDSHGRALWALGVAAAEAAEPGVRAAAARLLAASLPCLDELAAPRARAFALLGLVPAVLAGTPGLPADGHVRALADGLADLFDRTATDDWAWFEPYLTYCNARLPEALLAAHEVTGEARYAAVAAAATGFLVREQFTPAGRLEVVGHDGWYQRHRVRALFDQQPVDAGAMVELLARAARVLESRRHARLAERAMAWFAGANRIGRPLVDPATGACYDGLHPHGVNRNQGAESALAYLLARLALPEPPPRAARAAAPAAAHA